MQNTVLATIYGIGVGPGDPQLLTLRAAAVLREVGAVLAPRSAEDRDSLALAIARPHLPVDCAVLEAVFPMTEDRATLEQAWEDAARQLIAVAEGGRPAAFLTLGDAMLYSTWSYLMAAVRRLRPDATIDTVPGITAMSACAAAVGQPLAEGRAPLLVWPDEPPAHLDPLTALAPNIVFMKAARHLDALADAVDALGADAVAVRRCSLPDQAVTRDLRAWESGRSYFTTVLMHANPTPSPSPTGRGGEKEQS
jgi:precorrin-2/cobalt-factor-2 C20-methyltransferase